MRGLSQARDDLGRIGRRARAQATTRRWLQQGRPENTRAQPGSNEENNGFTSLFQEAEFISEGSNRTTVASNK
jgi:hypothetical protein